MAGVGLGDGGYLLGGADGDDISALIPGLGTEIDEMVGRLDEVKVMFDEDDAVARIYQPLQNLEEGGGVFEGEAGGRFVENVDGAARGTARKLGGELDALGLAAAEGGCGLANLDVAQAHVPHGVQLAANAGEMFEDPAGLLDGHVQYLGDGVALELDLQGLTAVAAALADLAGDCNVGEELHLDLVVSLALAGLAPAALDVE